jgi:hypothetical protein
MALSHVTWKGPEIDDAELLEKLPPELSGLLSQLNGFIQFHGGLHVRGVSSKPKWHSLREAWEGDKAFHRLYPKVKPTDIPFAEDYLGNQFFLRNRKVVFLDGETGDTDPLRMGLREFFEAVEKDPVEFLQLEILLEFQQDGGALKPGELLAVMPPLCSEQASEGISTSPVSAAERHTFLAKLAAFLKDLPKDGKFEFQVGE